MGHWLKRMSLIAAFVLIPATAIAQAPATPASQADGPEQQLLKPQELDGLVAPIALYPDSLLSLVLMGSTYPLEIVHAERWLSANKLKGDQLKAAVDKQAWDDSIKSLAATPDVKDLGRLTDRIASRMQTFDPDQSWTVVPVTVPPKDND